MRNAPSRQLVPKSNPLAESRQEWVKKARPAEPHKAGSPQHSGENVEGFKGGKCHWRTLELGAGRVFKHSQSGRE